MITFNNKTTLNSQPDIANENKVTASDMNEIKSVYNTEIGDITDLDTTDKTSVVNAINEVNGKIKSANITGTTNQNGEVNVTNFNSNFKPSTILILFVKVLDKIPFVTTNATGTTLFVGFRNRGTTYSPVSNGTSISFAIYYIEI
jgi:hypothetical protein